MGFFDSLFGKKKEDAVSKKKCPVCGMEFSDKGMDVYPTERSAFPAGKS